MSQSKRLHFKDLDSLRFFALIPVFLSCTLYLTQTETEGVHYELAALIRYIRQNSFDFFFFISSFLLTSHGLREYKYTHSFSIRNFYLRRLLRIMPLLFICLLFAFVIHPWIIKTLKLNSMDAPSAFSYILLIPNYIGSATRDQYVYLSATWLIYMFLQFYIFWGIILKFFKPALTKVAIGCMLIGVAARIVRLLTDTGFEFDTFSYGVAIGMGAILAKIVREDSPYLEKVRLIPKKLMFPLYITGLMAVLSAYVLSDNFIYVSLVPFITCLFYGFVVIEQTFGKNFTVKFRNNKLFSQLGKISFGILTYQSMLGVMIIIGIDSLDFEINSVAVKIAFTIMAFALSWVIADLSYTFFEKPLLRLRREFKKA